MTRRSRSHAITFRLWCLGLMLLSGGLLATAAAISPRLQPGAPAGTCWAWASHGLGTHTQLASWLGHHACNACGCWERYRIPCPTCGMTTAVSLLVHGHALCATTCQPFGCAVGLTFVAVFVMSGLKLLTGPWQGYRPRSETIERAIIVTTVFFGLSWVYKVIATVL